MLLTLAWSNNIQADTSVATWSALKTAMENDGTINVTADCTDPSPSTTSYLEVPTGKTVILNLNGHTLNRGLGNNTEGIDNGLVIKNSGTLTINGSGTITGGNNNGHGGGIYSEGTLNLNNVNVTNNKAKNYGGGISQRLNGALNITGGSITGNIASFMHGGGIYASVSLSITDVVIQNNTCGESGGGIFCYTGKTLTISGSNTISDNKSVSGTRTSVNNVYLQSSAIINVAGNISNSIIGVKSNGVFTSGLSGKGTASNFFSDDPTCAITLNGSGEAQTESINNWATLKAAMAAGGKIKLASNCTRSSGSDGDLTISSGKEVELDLNSCTINGGNINSHIFMVYGKLTVNDTGGNGRITGGNVSGTGGAIWASNGDVIINGGTITGNTANSGGGGIYHTGSGGIEINGGSISGNTGNSNGGGILLDNGYLTINGGSIINNTTGGGIISNKANNQITISSNSGKVTIQNNKANPTNTNDLNLELKEGQNITIGGALTTDSRIGIIIANDAKRAFTSGLKNKGTASNFTADYKLRAITLNSSGEAQTNTIISSVVITDISTPVAGQTLDYSASCSTTGISSNSVIWRRGNSNLDNNATATAGNSHSVRVTLIPSDFYAFTSSSTATINGNSASVTLDNGKLIASYGFPATTKVTPTITTVPTGSDITYGQALSSSTLSGGVASTTGSFAWTTPTTKPNAGDGQSFEVTFTPSDATNYNTCTTNANVNVTKAALTVTASNKTITYGDEEANAGVTYTGFVNGETSAVLGSTLTYTYPKYVNSTLAGSYSAGSPVSDENTNYKIAPNGLTSGNYDITFVDGTLTVAQKEATLSWTNTELTYNGTAQKPTASVSNIVTGDACTVTVSGEQTNASSSAYTATATALGNANYKLPTADADKQTSFTIGKAALTVTAAAKSKTYGDTDPALTYTSEGELFGTDAITGALTRAAGEDVNSYAITQGTLTAGGNYSITYTGANLTITQKEVGITWGQTLLTYNNMTQAPEATASGLVGTDVCNVTVSGAAKEVGSYTATATGLSNANYKLPTTGLSTPFQIVDQLVISFAADQQWSTWYGLNNYQVPAGMTAYKVTAIGEDKVTVDAINYIPANTGVLLYRTETDAAMVTGNAYTGATSSITSLLKSGSPTPYKDYILHSNQFVLSTVSTIGANRCYLPGSSAAGARGGLLIDTTGGGTTDLFFDTTDASENDSWFDLQGRGIEKPQKKGLYIRNGKKVVVK